jgi:transcription termination factor Rho
MSETRQLDGMTVIELRKYAKENGIPLSTVTTKAAIIEKISKALAARMNKSAKAETESEISRRATIITDDGEDSAVLASPPPTRPQPDKTRTSTGKVKPVFTLQGSRAWHNPQPFAQTQAQQSKYAPQLNQGVNTFARDSGGMETGAYTPTRQRVMASKVSRFGPSASGGIPEPSVDSVLPAGQTGVNEASVIPEITLPEFDFQPQETIKDFRMNPAVPEMLATGDCGDGAGVLEIQQDGYGFLRAGNLLPGKNDVYVSGTQIRRFRLRNGDHVVGKTRPQRENDRYAAMLYITNINGEEPDGAVKLGGSLTEIKQRRDFDELTPTYPTRRIALSSRDENDLVLRLIDLFVPVGFGQRAMIVAAPKAGKTTILKKIALSLKRNHPDVHTMILLVDERPEEVTDLKETVGGDIFYSTFDEPAENHAKVSELTLERAMRLVEMGKDVVILLDSLTRLSRAYNTLMPGSARVMTGGLAAGAMNKPKRFFGAARSLKEGGSLTIIATALVDTGSRMDGVIFEEFKGTGNMELTLDRQLSERRLFPAVSLPLSGTRHDELLLTQKELEVAAKVRDRFSFSSEQESISLLLSMLEKSRDNEEFVSRYDDWMKLLRSRD